MKKPLIKLDTDDDDENILDAIRDLVGEEVADKLQMAAAGTRITIPSARGFSSRSSLARMVGYEDAARIVEAISPSETSIPEVDIPVGSTSGLGALQSRVDNLLQEDGLTTREIALLVGCHMRTIFRRRAQLRSKGVKIGNPRKPRTSAIEVPDNIGTRIVRTLLLEGYSPSQLRDVLNVPGEAILTIRAELIREGKL
ncbi:MAG: hypothetical protein O9256_04370 [Rhizobiaceae bacterium]|nr:hypothetical protein [Rhizobiaceae bacterium]MCZ8352971.1 hypothetical protein [Rhizobium sp.]